MNGPNASESYEKGCAEPTCKKVLMITLHPGQHSDTPQFCSDKCRDKWAKDEFDRPCRRCDHQDGEHGSAEFAYLYSCSEYV